MERSRAQAYNIQRLAMILGPVLLDIGAVELLIRLPFGPIQLIQAELSWALISVPLSLALLIIGIGISILAIDLDERLIRLFPPARRLPAPITDWLRINGYENTFQHWPELAWSHAKRLANCTEFLRFTFWRRSPAPIAQVEKIARRMKMHVA